jgi:hypothetical protein
MVHLNSRGAKRSPNQWSSRLEDRKCLLGALCGVARDHSKVLRTQLDLAGLTRHCSHCRSLRRDAAMLLIIDNC